MRRTWQSQALSNTSSPAPQLPSTVPDGDIGLTEKRRTRVPLTASSSIIVRRYYFITFAHRLTLSMPICDDPKDCSLTGFGGKALRGSLWGGTGKLRCATAWTSPALRSARAPVDNSSPLFSTRARRVVLNKFTTRDWNGSRHGKRGWREATRSVSFVRPSGPARPPHPDPPTPSNLSQH